MPTTHTDRQTRARGIVVALYRGKVVARWGAGGAGAQWAGTGRGAGAQGPTRGRRKLRAGGSWREARKNF